MTYTEALTAVRQDDIVERLSGHRILLENNPTSAQVSHALRDVCMVLIQLVELQ